MVKRFMIWIAILSILPLTFSSLARVAYTQNPFDQTLSRKLVSGSRIAQTTTIEFGGQLGFHYNPKDIRIAPGDSVKWQGDFTMHPLVSDEGLWTTVNSGSEFTFIFNQPGIYHFHCFFHGPIGMNGTATVGFYEYLPVVHK